MKKRLTYSYKGTAIPDYQAEHVALQLKDVNLHVSTENVVAWVRAHVVSGKLNPEEFDTFYVDKNNAVHSVHIKDMGEIDGWAEGFCDCIYNAMDVIYGKENEIQVEEVIEVEDEEDKT